MDDLTNSFNYFVTSGDYCSHTNLASNIHPRLLDYKKKQSSNQELRRRQILEDQKKKRNESIDQTRHIVDTKNGANPADQYLPKHKKTSYKKAPYNLMLSEWLDEIPDDFEKNWIMCLCPVGKRCLVVASEGNTVIYNKAGKVIYKHRSKLPGGGNESQVDFTVLDCVYDDTSRTYYVLDCLCWKSHPILDTETEFRFYWLNCKIEEKPEVKIISSENPYRFLNIPRYYECKKEIMEKALFEMNIPFELDGVLFFHKETHYTCDYTPLVGWLKPYMFPEILNVQVPESVIKAAPDDYLNAKNTILNSNIEIERLKNYLINKTAADAAVAAELESSELESISSMETENKAFVDGDEIEQ